MADFRLALRLLARSPLLSLVVILSLGLGIGANTAIFSFLQQVLLRSLPVERPEELVVLSSPAEFKSGRQSSDNSGGIDAIFSYRMFRGLEQRARGVSGLAGFRRLGANLAFQGHTMDGSVMMVSGGYFSVLGVRPRIGRLIVPEDDAPGNARPVVVLSHSYWRNRLGGRLEALNQPLRVNTQVFTVVGVAAQGFTGTTFGNPPDVFVPLSFQPRMSPTWDGTKEWPDYWLYIFARLGRGVTREQEAAALNSVYRGLVEEQANATAREWRIPEDLARFRQSKLTLSDGRRGQSAIRDATRVPLFILMASTVLVLLIAIANSANVLLARAAQRRRELSIRTALGASRGRLIRQLLLEAMLLAAGGGVAGLALAWATMRALAAALSRGSTPAEDLAARLDWPVLLFALATSLLSGLLCGLYPAWQAARSAVAESLKDESGHASGSRGASRVRQALVSAQVMVSALLLVSSGLFLKSLVNLLHVDLGIRTENLVVFRIAPELNGYQPARSRELFARAEERLSAIPGVRSVTASMVPLIAGSNWGTNLVVEGYSRDPRADRHSMVNLTGSGFFGKMGVPLIVGREFTDRDTLPGPRVAIVNEQFARHFFGNRSPLGWKFTPIDDAKPDIEIVGVVKDTLYSNVKQKPPRLFYLPWRQAKDVGRMTFYVRSALSPDQVLPQVRRVMRSLDPDLPLQDLRTFEKQIDENIRSDWVVLQLSSAFSVVATLLAMLGLYGVMAYSVTRRTREIGIRVALGAPVARIRAMVLRELLIILGAGLALGIPGAVALARLTESQLFGVKSFDGTVVAGAALALTAAALLAAYLPARRATRVSPIVALRYE